uniref:Uncharacterized protein n=1 Tax=Plectus sambesii TaxID=2011161 RepID=A0A914WLR8_9BILA
MKLVAIIFVVFALTIAPSYQDTVDPNAACGQEGVYYAQGCSGLVAALLRSDWKHTSAYRRGAAIGSNGRYRATPGTIVGFSGHVAVYIGHADDTCNCMFIDVPGPKKRARCLQSYGSQTVYKYYY